MLLFGIDAVDSALTLAMLMGFFCCPCSTQNSVLH